MDANPGPTKTEMMAALTRSGYRMEGRLIKILTANGYVVETSQSLFDETTQKSREVDLVADPFVNGEARSLVCVKTALVIEAVNNTLPVALLTPHLPHPFLAEEFIPYNMTPGFTDAEHPFFGETTHAELNPGPICARFSQYCGFSRKKAGGEWMASHPDDLHSSLQKAVEYAMYRKARDAGWMGDLRDTWWRIFNWQPVIVVHQDLFVLKPVARGERLSPVPYAEYIYNFHYNRSPESVAVTFVTEKALDGWLKEMLARDAAAEAHLARMRKKGNPAGGPASPKH